MKKFIYSLAALLALATGFTACGDDNDDPSYSYDTTAEVGSAGTYSGTWTRISDDGTESFSGSVTLSAGSQTGTTNVSFSCPESALSATSIANVWHSNDGYQFVNQMVSDANKLGASFAGRISGSGELTTAFTLSQKVGRKTVSFKYSFIGQK